MNKKDVFMFMVFKINGGSCVRTDIYLFVKDILLYCKICPFDKKRDKEGTCGNWEKRLNIANNILKKLEKDDPGLYTEIALQLL